MRALVTVVLIGTTALFACAAPSHPPGHPPGVEMKDMQTRVYHCGNDKTLKVTYWNSVNGQSFALVPIDGKSLLFVDTLSASGVRYAAGRYVWWTKGELADLHDTSAGDQAPPIIGDCQSEKAKAS